MAVYEWTIGTVCGECGYDFIKPFRVYNVTNTDYISSIKDNLLSDKLNKVTCPKCNSTFTYEREFLAYSLKKNYAVYGLCEPSKRTHLSGRIRLVEMLHISGMKFRLVDYLCEVAEKVSIFENNLNDITIEMVKHHNFPARYFEDNSENNLLFRTVDGEDMIFEYINSTDEVLEIHKIPFSEYQKYKINSEPESTKDGFILWTKTDNKYIKEICHE